MFGTSGKDKTRRWVQKSEGCKTPQPSKFDNEVDNRVSFNVQTEVKGIGNKVTSFLTTNCMKLLETSMEIVRSKRRQLLSQIKQVCGILSDFKASMKLFNSEVNKVKNFDSERREKAIKSICDLERLNESLQCSLQESSPIAI